MGSPRNLKRSFESILQYHRDKGIRAKHFMKRPVPTVALSMQKIKLWTTHKHLYMKAGRGTCKDTFSKTFFYILYIIMLFLSMHIWSKVMHFFFILELTSSSSSSPSSWRKGSPSIVIISKGSASASTPKGWSEIVHHRHVKLRRKWSHNWAFSSKMARELAIMTYTSHWSWLSIPRRAISWRSVH